MFSSCLTHTEVNLGFWAAGSSPSGVSAGRACPGTSPPQRRSDCSPAGLQCSAKFLSLGNLQTGPWLLGWWPEEASNRQEPFPLSSPLTLSDLCDRFWSKVTVNDHNLKCRTFMTKCPSGQAVTFSLDVQIKPKQNINLIITELFLAILFYLNLMCERTRVFAHSKLGHQLKLFEETQHLIRK